MKTNEILTAIREEHFKLNDKVRVSPENDNENYNSFRDEILIVTNVAKNKNDHPGYDEGVTPDYLYDLKTANGKEVNCSLYDYELTKA